MKTKSTIEAKSNENLKVLCRETYLQKIHYPLKRHYSGTILLPQEKTEPAHQEQKKQKIQKSHAIKPCVIEKRPKNITNKAYDLIQQRLGQQMIISYASNKCR